LRDDNPHVAEYAGAALGRLGDPRATAALLPRLDDASKWMRRRTIAALTELNDATAIGKIGGHMADASREVRQEALNALIHFCDVRIARVNDVANRRRTLERTEGKAEELAEADKQLQAAREEFLIAFRPAEKAAQDEFPMVRQTWLGVLPRYQEAQDTLDVIVRALSDEDHDVRAAALAALGQLRQNAEQRQQLDAFRQRTAGARARLTELLGDYYQEVRERAVEVFAGLTGQSIEEATQRTADQWKAQIPRPGDPRSPHAEYWKKAAQPEAKSSAP
jgi:HEAT repeat protein